jgi:GrpB-like predicted nucleotidyltransferase (UPF0157 family)
MLGLARDCVELVPHDPAWSTAFREEAALLRAALGDHTVQIEHVGSTSIPGLEAKPILDIVVAVRDPSQLVAFAAAVAPLGYQYKPDPTDPGRLYFVKRLADGHTTTHHLNLCELGSECWVTHVAFRDYLLAHPEAREEYRALKHDLAERFRHDRPAYTEGKAAFIQSILAKAASQ